MQFPDARILIFAKAPLPGQVKTRLQPVLGAEGAARLYSYLLVHRVTTLAETRLCPLQLWCAPDFRHPLFTELALRYAVELREQRGADLGERMQHAADSALTESGPVLLVGGDCPSLTPDHLEQALHALDTGHDAVLGPAEDGGYVLLGLKRAMPELFTGLPWGTGQVLARTRARLLALGWRWQELPTLWDLDRAEDLARLAEHFPGLWSGGNK